MRPIERPSLRRSCLRSVAVVAVAAGFAGFGSSAAASSINYPDFGSTAGLTLNGSATQAGNVLRLTDTSENQAGTAFTDTAPINPTDSFESHFTFSLHDGSSLLGTQADGITFVLQNSTSGAQALGGNGGGLGYSGIAPSVAVEFDIFQNDWDADANHVAVLENGDVASEIATQQPTFGLWGSGKVSAWVDYENTTGTLKVYVAQSEVKPSTPLITASVDLPGILGSQPAFAGFTGATGWDTANQDVLSWDMTTSSGGSLGPDPSGHWGLELNKHPLGIPELDAEVTISGWKPSSSTFTGSGTLLGVLTPGPGGIHLRHDPISLTGRYVGTSACLGLKPCVSLSLKLPQGTASLIGNPFFGCGELRLCWTGDGSDDQGANYTWSACRDCAANLPSARFKAFAQYAQSNIETCEAVSGALADSSQGTPGWIEKFQKLVTVVGALCGFGADDLTALADDPPDSNYRLIASPQFVRRTRVPHVFPSKERRRLQRLLDSARKETAILHALRVSLERAQGAEAARNGEWTLRQLIAASSFAHKSANDLRSEASALAKLRPALHQRHAANPRLTVKQVRRVQRQLKQHGFPKTMKRLLRRLGATHSDLAAMLKTIEGPPAHKLAGRPLSRITSTGFVRRLGKLAKLLDKYSGNVAEHPFG
jgi:hypothetical protein